MKPGYKTTEFWFTLVSFIFSGLYLTGIISEHDTKENLTEIVTHAVESCILIGGQLGIFYKYIKSRNEEKARHERSKDLENYVGIDNTKSKININEAGIGELIQLPHIGPGLAQKIIDYRSKFGEFEYIQQIIDINGIGGATYKDIEPHITV